MFKIAPNQSLFVIVFINLAAVIFLLFFVFFKPENRIVYINNVELFNGFNMSKDLGGKHKSEISKLEKSFDSLVTIYNIFSEQKNQPKIQETQVLLKQKEQQLLQLNDYLTKEVSQQVWNRLNVYIKEYGKQRNYQYILGTQGNGNLMYVEDEEALNVTESLLEYANSKYEGE